MQRGQISIEFILLIMVSLIFIHMIILPTADASIESTRDVKKVAGVKLAAEQIAAAVNQLAASSGEAKKTIMVFVPEGTWIECDAHKIKFGATISNQNNRIPDGCDGSTDCEGYVDATIESSDKCTFASGTLQAGYKKLTIKKGGGGVSVYEHAE